MFIKKQLKIFVDGYLLNKEHQGTKTYVRELYKVFAKQNPDILIFIGCFKDAAIEDEFKHHKNVKFIYFTYSNRVFRMIYEIPKIINSYNFHFAHFQYVIPFVTSKSCKYIVTIHDILFNDFTNYFSKAYRLKRNFLFKYSAKRADFLLTVSNYSKDRIRFHYKLQNKEILVTPNGVSDDFFKETEKSESIKYIDTKFGINNYILYVSRIEPRKNQQSLLKAFLEMNDQKVHIVFIGFKSINNIEFDSILDSLNSEQKSKVHILQNISDNDLFYFINAARIFAYPSLAEGFGIPPLEAGAMKTPVVCSNKTAMSDFDFFNKNLIDVDDVESLKASLKNNLYNDNESHLAFVQKSIKEKYHWKKASDVLTDIIKS